MTESLEIAKSRYETGKLAFENGQYREAVENLEKEVYFNPSYFITTEKQATPRGKICSQD